MMSVAETEPLLQHQENDIADWIALTYVPGFGPATRWRLLETFGSAAAIWAASPDALVDAGIAPDHRHHLSEKHEAALQRAHSVLSRCAEVGIGCLSPRHPHYPARLKQIHDPPVALFYRGQTDVLAREKQLAVVGTRRASDYGRQATRKLIHDLRGSDVSIVSGLAEGIDGEAHQTALDAGLPTVAVFGCGLDTVFPAFHKPLARRILATGSVLISEYPPGTAPARRTFPQRNRIVAGMSAATLVVEGNIKSGAMITAKLALSEGRSVFALPGNIFNPVSDGPHWLIKNGAPPVTHGLEILSELKWDATRAALETRQSAEGSVELPETMSDAEKRLLNNISYDPMACERLGERMQWSTATLTQTLTMLELEGLIEMLPGCRVKRC